MKWKKLKAVEIVSLLDDVSELINKAKFYWGITKDKVKKCCNCELRFACFDCREIAYRKNKNIYDENPNCLYNPQKGIWEGE